MVMEKSTSRITSLLKVEMETQLKKYNLAGAGSQKSKSWIMGLLKQNGILGIMPCDTIIKTSLET